MFNDVNCLSSSYFLHENEKKLLSTEFASWKNSSMGNLVPPLEAVYIQDR